MVEEAFQVNVQKMNINLMRLSHPGAVPRDLVEQLEDRDWPVENFYGVESIRITTNPLNYLHLITDGATLVGFSLASINPMYERVVHWMLSIYPHYEEVGIQDMIYRFYIELAKELGLRGVRFTTSYYDAPDGAEDTGTKVWEVNVGE